MRLRGAGEGAAYRVQTCCCFFAGMCAAYINESHVLEVYQYTLPFQNHGVLELKHVFKDVHKLPVWRDSLVQVRPITVRSNVLLCFRALDALLP